MRYTVLASPGSDPGEARARASAVVEVAHRAALAAAARACADPYVVLLAAGARPLAGAFGGLTAALDRRPGVLGGVAVSANLRRFGWMLAHAPVAPAGWELVPVTAASDVVDVAAPEMVAVATELLHDELPADPVAAMVELTARARAAGRTVACRPAFACAAQPPGLDDRGRAAALLAVGARHPELAGGFRLPPGLRREAVEREQRLTGGRRLRVRTPLPAIAVLIHGEGAALAVRRARELSPRVTSARAVDDPATALRAEMRVRGDRYVLVARAGALPTGTAFEGLVEALESAPFVALAAPAVEALDGACVLIALARLPQHVVAHGTTVESAIASLVSAAHGLRRAVRAPGFAPPCEPVAAPPRPATLVFAAASQPEVLRLTLSAAIEGTRAGDELVAVCAAGATTVRRIIAAYPHVRVDAAGADPLLADAVNRAIGSARGDLVALVADDVLLPAGTLDRLRDAFARYPALGAAFPAVPGSPGAEGVGDVQYADIAQLHALAHTRAHERARELEPIDLAVSPVIVVAREALDAVGGIDPAYGPTRRGIAGLVLRLRAAGYAVVRCDDAIVHRFAPELSHNPAAAADQQQPIAAAEPAAIARGFDPAHRVPFVRETAPAQGAALTHVVAVPVAGAADLERAAAFLAVAARTFDASAPIRLDVLLDGAVSPADAVARIRPILAASAPGLDATVAVRIERTPDLAGWRAGIAPDVRVVVAAGHERDALDLATVVTAQTLPGLLHAVAP